MVISVLAGGLGNQLFQYAFGFSVAHQLNTALRLERHLLENQALARLRQYTPRTYELDTFTIKEVSASGYDTIRCLSKSLFTSQKAVVLRESSAESLLHLSPRITNAICIGYWQSESYFENVSDQLRQQLVFQKPISPATRSIADAIKTAGTMSVFLHVRRGDYVTNSKANQHHGVCDGQYYQRAVNYLRERVANPQFFVFSDDQGWAQQALKEMLHPAVFIEHNQGADNWQDMYLMSLCTHAIIANSSFSWWGAWLNPVRQRVVVAPRRWFTATNLSLPSVIPTNWKSV